METAPLFFSPYFEWID